MTDVPGPANSGEKQGGRFERGQSGNPQGRPAGSRNKASILLDKMADDEAEAIQRLVIDAAKTGDLKAAELLLARIWPPRRGRSVRIELAPVQSAAGVSEAMAAVVDAMAAGDITPDEAATITGILEIRRKVIETQELAERISRLERKMERT
jgi:thioredoxin-like negative regulator of GroEL